MDSELQIPKTALAERWPRPAGGKAARYIDQFFERKRTGAKIVARVVGNHGTYTVSIEARDVQVLLSACSCYIGKHGGCHHCTALDSLNLKVGQKFLYLYDYWDEWRFTVRVHAIHADAPVSEYPRVVEVVGELPQSIDGF